MDVDVNNSDSEDETQATQILHGMLDMDSFRTSNTRGSGGERLEKELTDSSPLPVSRSLPNYDFQGLAQTQTQHAEQEAKGSQKENIHMRNGEREVVQRQSNAPHIVSTLDSSRKARGLKAVSFQSPRGKSGPVNPTITSAHRQPTRSTTYPSTTSAKHSALPPSSQDSFGMIDDDPEQQFLAASKQFNVPLSELSRVVLAGSHEPTGTKRNEESKSLMRGRPRRSSSPHEGIVLVAATPSVSGSSQSQQSEPSVQAGPSEHRVQQRDHRPDDGGHDIRHGSATDDCLSDAPSSNIYSDFGDRDKDDRAIPAFDATQPSTQVEDDGLENNALHPFDVPLPVSNKAVSSNNLISTVDPKKRHRYQRHLDKPVGLPQVQHFLQSPSQTSASAGVAMEETQPSFEPETWVPPKRQFPRANAVDPSPGGENDACVGQQTKIPALTVHPSKPYNLDDRVSTNEIIPDSEPLRAPNSEGGINQSTRLHRSPSRLGKEASIPVDTKGLNPDAVALGKHRIPLEEEDDDNVPLAATHAKFNGKPAVRQSVTKGKGKDATEGSHVPNPPLETQMKSVPEPNVSSHVAAPRPTKKQNIGRQWANEEVPSSHPEQDLRRVTETKRLPVNVASAKGNRKPASTRASARPKRNTDAPATKSRRRPVVDSQSPPPASDDEATIPADDNDDTDPADEEYMKQEIPGPSSRKRKRNNPPARTKADSKASTASGKIPSTTPSTRQAKRLRSAAPTSRMGGQGAARVFALWKQDGHYYPGTVHSYMGGIRYTIHFDDATESVVNLDQMRTLDLRVGDDILLPKLARGVKIVDVTKFESSDLVSVRLDAGITEVHLEAVKIASRTISYAWKDRTLNPDTIVTIVGPERVKPSPTPSKMSMLSGPSTRGLHSSIFDRTAFIVTISPNGNPGKDKDSVMLAITTNGGKVINDWSNVIRMEGKHSQLNNRWVIEKSEAGWMGDKDIDRIFLVADDSCLKPKFLIALALGVPCLSVTWLHESIDVGEEKDWLPYMLPQGHSEALDARASQQVDVDWGNSVHQLDEIMDNRVPCKLFKEKSILCVGAEMVPTPKGKKASAQEKFAQDARNAVTRIILAMGADRVEAVTDVKHASAPISSFDFVVIKEDHQYGPHLGNGRIVHWSWVKDCLIASRLIPLPEWDQTCQSQDA